MAFGIDRPALEKFADRLLERASDLLLQLWDEPRPEFPVRRDETGAGSPAVPIDDGWQLVTAHPDSIAADGEQVPPSRSYTREQLSNMNIYYDMPLHERTKLERTSRPSPSWTNDLNLAALAAKVQPGDLRLRRRILLEASDNGEALATLARTNTDPDEWEQIFQKSRPDSEARSELARITPDFARRNRLFDHAGSHDPVLIGLGISTRSHFEFKRIVKKAGELSVTMEHLAVHARSAKLLRLITRSTPVHSRACQIAQHRLRELMPLER